MKMKTQVLSVNGTRIWKLYLLIIYEGIPNGNRFKLKKRKQWEERTKKGKQ